MRAGWTFSAIGLVLAAPLGCSSGRDDRAGAAPSSIEYRGERIPISREYADFDQYKDDPNNLPPESARRAATLVEHADVRPVYEGREALTAAMFDLQFPGYGLMAAGERSVGDGTVLSMFAIELPQAERSRYLVFRGRGSRYELVDDFVESDDRAIYRVELDMGKLTYKTARDEVVVQHAPRER